MPAASPVCRWGQRQALRDRDPSRVENMWETEGDSGPRSVNSELHTQPAWELCGGLCGAALLGPGLRGLGKSGQDPKGYVQCCQMSIQGRGPRGVKSLPQWQILTELGTL